MRIQCERCSTTYELDESRLPPSGAPVQCTRCQHVFRAFPPGAGGKTWIGQPPAPAPVEPGPRAPPRPRPVAPPASPSVAPSPPAESRRERPAPQARREPPAAEPARPYDPRNNTTLSRFRAELRSGRRRTWLLTAGLAVVVAGGLGAWLTLRGRVAPEALALRGEGDGYLLQDDRASLERAAARYAAAAAVAPTYAAAKANEALALLLLSDDAADEARPAEERFRTLEAERSREAAVAAPGWVSREADIVSRMKGAQAESQPSRDRARELKAQAVVLLRAVAREPGSGPEAARALALYYALDGEAERAAQAAGRANGDPWKTLALAAAKVKKADPTRGAEEIAALEALAAAHPEILRARLLLARALAASGKRDEAVAVLDGILAANAAHERAKALKAEVLALPAAAVSHVPLRGKAPVGQPGKLPRHPPSN